MKKATAGKGTKKDEAGSPVHGPVPSQEHVQPEVNIGLVGHVDHGKTSITERLSGKWTDTHSEELKRGITIRLGYADVMIRKCPSCTQPACFTSKESCAICNHHTIPLRKISLVDAPGHESLMATMLAGTMIMDGALLLVAANEGCPQPQTREHLMALEILGMEKLIVVQNKIDLVNKEQALKNYEEIRRFLKGTRFADAPIVPVSAQHRINIDVLLETIQTHIPTPQRDPAAEPLMLVARSFDVNRPGILPHQLVGGVLGGALIRGRLHVGEDIELRPGRKVEKGNKIVYEALFTKIISLHTGGQHVEEALPGGSIGLMTDLDPAVVKSDALTGALVGNPGKLPPVWETLILENNLLPRVVGAKEELEVQPIKLGEALMLNVNSAATIGIVTRLGKKTCTVTLKLAVCAEAGSRVTISRRIQNRYRLIGYGTIKKK